MTVIAPEHCKAAIWIEFENPLDVRVMAIDGTWCRDCQLTQVSETEAQIRLIGPALNDTEFFLLLTKFGKPVFRMCRRRWVNGMLIGVSFHKDFVGGGWRNLGEKPLDCLK
jgi:hypothetical protein